MPQGMLSPHTQHVQWEEGGFEFNVNPDVKNLGVYLYYKAAHSSCLLRNMTRLAASTVTLPDAAPAAQPCQEGGEQTGS
jgi:hypothetical protein